MTPVRVEEEATEYGCIADPHCLVWGRSAILLFSLLIEAIQYCFLEPAQVRHMYDEILSNQIACSVPADQ